MRRGRVRLDGGEGKVKDKGDGAPHCPWCGGAVELLHPRSQNWKCQNEEECGALSLTDTLLREGYMSNTYWQRYRRQHSEVGYDDGNCDD